MRPELKPTEYCGNWQGGSLHASVIYCLGLVKGVCVCAGLVVV